MRKLWWPGWPPPSSARGRPRREREGEAAHALLAEDRLAALRAQHAPGARSGRRTTRPSEPGYILGFKEQVLVDSKDPEAKPLPIGKMMIHHFLYFAPGRVDQGARRVLERRRLHRRPRRGAPDRRHAARPARRARAHYGINNRRADGTAPDWRLTAMVMNHYKRPKRFYVRTKVWYTTEPRKSIMPLVIGNCAQLGNGMAYDVPGGGAQGLGVRRPERVGRALQRAADVRRLAPAWRRQVPDAREPHLRTADLQGARLPRPAQAPLQHDPADPARARADRQRDLRHARGVPIHEGEVLRRVAVHDNHNLHVASMGFWATWFVRDDSVERCGKLPNDIVDINKPKRFDRTPNHELGVPQLVAAARGLRRLRRQSARDRRQLLPARQGAGEGGRAGDLELRRHAPAQRDGGQRPARLLVGLLGPHHWQLHRHADGEGHLQAGLPRAPHDDGADARGQVAGN